MPTSAGTRQERPAFRVGDDVVVEAPVDGRRYLGGRLKAFKGLIAIVELDEAQRVDSLAGKWLRLTRASSDRGWRDPVGLEDVRLYRHSPRLRNPWGNRKVASAGTMRRRDAAGEGTP